jgi:hypothetical protein
MGTDAVRVVPFGYLHGTGHDDAKDCHSTRLRQSVGLFSLMENSSTEPVDPLLHGRSRGTERRWHVLMIKFIVPADGLGVIE